MKKAARYLFALFFIISLNFFIPRIMPGDPITNLTGEDFLVDQESIDQLQSNLGLDKPIFIQYLHYWKDVFGLNLGYSYHFHEKVAQLILSKMKWTLLLLGTAILLGFVLGTLLGALSGWNRNTLGNKAATTFILSLYSTPSFFLSLIVLYIFGFKLGLFPLKGFYESRTLLDIIHHLFLPVAVFAVFLAARNYMIMRGSVLQEKGKLYALYARAKGLMGQSILFRHIFKNASLPLVTLIALDFGFIFSGALFIEIVFSMNGMGTLIFDALLARDYPVLQGSFLVITVMVVLANSTADLIYGFIDPRVRERA